VAKSDDLLLDAAGNALLPASLAISMNICRTIVRGRRVAALADQVVNGNDGAFLSAV
jgi:hypothetical protein